MLLPTLGLGPCEFFRGLLLCRRRVNYGKSILLKKKIMARAFVSSADGCSRHLHGYAVLACRGSSTAWLQNTLSRAANRSPQTQVLSLLVGVGRAAALQLQPPDRITRASNDASQAPNPTRHPPAVSCNGSKYQGLIGVGACVTGPRFSRPGSTAPPVRARHGR